ncbi:MAG: hypothetical protein IT432_03355 [Phycisphaerales bacterium]|nr:hypothetical protein [Phycisphaerales bacterium]
MKDVIARMSGCTAALVVAASASAQLAIVSNLPGSFTDISQTGNFVDLGDEDEAFAFLLPISNALFPMGSAVIIGNNGGVGFSPPFTDLGPVPAPLPSFAAFGAGKSLLPYWADIGNHVGSIHWQQIGNTVIIQWTAKRSKPANVPGTFQIKIIGSSTFVEECIYAQFIYLDIQGAGWNGGANACIGFQDELLPSVQWSFLQPNAVHNNSVLSLVNTDCLNGQGCPADFNHDGFVNGLDYDLFATFFEAGDRQADINLDGFVNGLDYDYFASHFEAGC